ncbi:single-stranded DNA-binding protein [Marinitoga litoralis]|uniref:single-stranded DNA-binding protein n=1 Tax=Marinitoga litoralis TaxID=570855 RepID=UPI001961B7A3|nr:single-stranded DNA-binding protein [Marinitoga litoralis]MBM7558313.1 single-strand DNA-binding protein [Marinitoga litoralis]
MSYSFNRVILVGRLTRDPEVRMTTSGDKVANFTIAVDRPNWNSDFNGQKTDFIRIVVFGKRAEFAENYLRKGVLILVEGALRINTWRDQNNNYRERAEVSASSIQFMESKAGRDAYIADNFENNSHIEVIEPTIDEVSDDLDDFSNDDFPQFFPIDDVNPDDDTPPNF